MSVWHEFAAFALPVSLMLIVLSLGLRTSFAAATYLLREPLLLGKSVVAMYIAVPLIVAIFVMSFALDPAVKVALIALAVSPVPPLLPRKELKLVARGRDEYVFGLLVSTCLLAIVAAPAAVAVFAALFDVAAAVSPMRIARIVAFTVLLPLAAGLVLRRWLPEAERLAAPCETLGMVLLVISVVSLAVPVLPAAFSLLGHGTPIALVVVALLALLVGHVLGGPLRDDRTVLALAAATRHPGVAIAVASAVDQVLAPAAILLAFVVTAITALPYTAWRRRLRASAPTIEPTR